MRPSSTPTLKDVAREAGVTAMTVSAVLHGGRSGTRVSDATRARVEEVAARMRYRRNAVARGLSLRRMNTLGVAAEIGGGDINPYFLEVLEGILEAAVLHGQNTSVLSVSDWACDEQRLLEFCDGRVDGIICIGPELTSEFGATLNQHIPFVTVHGTVSISGICGVDIDNEGGAHTIVQYMIAQGHRRIAHFTGALGHHRGAQQRLAGYQRALAEAGIAPEEALVLSGDYTAPSGAACMTELLDRTGARPTAVFCANDTMAYGAMEAMAARGLRAPDDLSIGGFDDLMLARMTSPHLTTVRQPFHQMAKRAVEMLLAQILQSSSKEDEMPGGCADVFQAELIVRQTVGPVRQ